MLYKKVHRQYLREFKIDRGDKDRGREIKYSKPFIDVRHSTISIKVNEGKFRSYWDLINIKGSSKGRIQLWISVRDWEHVDDEDNKNDIGRVERLGCYIRRFIGNILDSFRKVIGLGNMMAKKLKLLENRI